MYIDAINDEIIDKNPFSKATAPKKGNLKRRYLLQ